MDGDILTKLLQAFMQVFTLGGQRLIPDARWILVGLVTIEIAVLGLWITLDSADAVAKELLRLAMKTAIYLFLITNWTTLTRALVKGFIAFGLRASGEVISETDFTDPSKVVWFGISAATLVYNRIFAYTGYDAMFNIADIIFSGMAATACLYVYGRFGLEVFTALLEFYCVSACTVVLIPFGMLRYTAFVTEKALALMWAYAIKLFVLAFVAGAALLIMLRLQPGLNPKFGEVMTLAGAGAAIVYLAHRVDKVAQALLHGSPQLTAQDLVQFAQATSQTIITAINAGRSLAPTPNGAADAPGRPL